MGEEREKKKREKEHNDVSQSADSDPLASHPFAGLFELFAFWYVLLSLLHIFLSLQQTPLNIVHQPALNKV